MVGVGGKNWPQGQGLENWGTGTNSWSSYGTAPSILPHTPIAPTPPLPALTPLSLWVLHRPLSKTEVPIALGAAQTPRRL